MSKDDHQISVEKRSFNHIYQQEDITDKCPDGKCCVAGCEAIIDTGLDVDRLCEFSNQNFDFFKSTGNLFVDLVKGSCCLVYKVLHQLETSNSAIPKDNVGIV